MCGPGIAATTARAARCARRSRTRLLTDLDGPRFLRNDVVVSSDDMTFGNKVMQVLGMAAVGYTLGTTDAKVLFNDKVMKIDGTAV